MKNIDVTLLLIYIVGAGLVSVVAELVFNSGHLPADWIWRSIYMGLTGGIILYVLDLKRPSRKK